MHAGSATLGALLAAALLSAPVGAATLYVAQEGVDGPGCGAKATPCRSISRAIQLAGSGDTLRVGPGRYGDLNLDGAFDDPGDEAAELGNGCDCMIRVPKPLTILSEAGAAATLIDGDGTVPTLVSVEADGVVFGRANQGFTLTGAGPTLLQGALEVFTAADVAIGGNVAAGNTGLGFVLLGARANVSDNRAIGQYLGFQVGGGSSLARNVAASNEYGVQLEGGGGTLRDDVLVGNRTNGLLVVNGTAIADLTRVQALGNGAPGIATTVPLAMHGGRITGNDAGGDNCGVELTADGSLDAEGVFWGAAEGPGDDPADRVCAEVGTTIDTDPPAKKAAKPKLKPLR